MSKAGQRYLQEHQDEVEEAIALATLPLVTALTAAKGYMRNAQIDLETGAPKRTAIATLTGGIDIVERALKAARGQ